MLRLWLCLSPAGWLFHGPHWRRSLAAWWLPRWYYIAAKLESDT